MLRLAVQGPLVKGDDVEESLKVSPAIAGEDEYVEFWPAGTLAKASSPVPPAGIA
jgi:hypothetical protein